MDVECILMTNSWIHQCLFNVIIHKVLVISHASSIAPGMVMLVGSSTTLKSLKYFDWSSLNDVISLCPSSSTCGGLMAATGELAPPTVYLHHTMNSTNAQ